jgi:TonB family protein
MSIVRFADAVQSAAMIRLHSIAAILLLLLGSVSAQAQTAEALQADLQQRLVGKLLTMRTPYAGEKLHFEADGKPVGNPQSGLRSVDGVLKIVNARIENSTLVFKGVRMVLVYDGKSGRLGISDPKWPVEIKIEAPGASAQDIGVVFNKVFFSKEELDARNCSDGEMLAFKSWVEMSNVGGRRKSKKDSSPSPNPESYCFPTGGRVYAGGAGIKPPRATKMQDPEYDETSRRAEVHGTSTFAVAIDDSGKPADALLISGGNARLNYDSIIALRKWRFDPATRDGKPIPVVIRMEMNFN